MRGLPLAFLVTSFLLVAGCSDPKSDAGNGGGEVHEIAMHSTNGRFVYEPESVTMGTSDTLRFTSHVGTHTATSTGPSARDTGDITQGTSKDLANLPAGTHVFHCRYHQAMELTVTVAT